jgi:hypothetical protein
MVEADGRTRCALHLTEPGSAPPLAAFDIVQRDAAAWLTALDSPERGAQWLALAHLVDRVAMTAVRACVVRADVAWTPLGAAMAAASVAVRRATRGSPGARATRPVPIGSLDGEGTRTGALGA